MESKNKHPQIKTAFKETLENSLRPQLGSEEAITDKARKQAKQQRDLERKERFFERRRVDISKRESRRVLEQVSAAGGRFFTSAQQDF